MDDQFASQNQAREGTEDRSLLIVDDDAPLRRRLERAMEQRGYVVTAVDSVATGVAAATVSPPAFAVVDLRLGDGSGLDVVAAVQKAREDARIIVLTGYGNIATAVAAVKAGAVDYLPKPADADQIAAALEAHGGALPPPPESLQSIAPRVLVAHGRDDAFIPAERIVAFQSGLDRVGADWEMTIYSGTRHGFTNPGADKRGMDACVTTNEPTCARGST